MAEQSSYERAKKRVEDLKGFYIHLLVYIVVNIALIAFNLLVTPSTLWFFWVLFGWGIGVISHAIAVFGFFGILGDEWEKKKIDELMQKDKKSEE